jgi:hypothetical protein
MIPHVKFYVVMETFPDADKDLTLRQEACVFDNKAKTMCKRPEEIDVSEIWNSLKNQSYINGLILGQYEKEVSQEIKNGRGK